MAEFKQLVITEKGHELMAKLMSGSTTAQFTEIKTSSKTYSQSALSNLTTLAEIKQTTNVSKVIRTNGVAVQIEGAVSNAELTEGYFIQTIGLYAKDPDLGTILYGVVSAKNAPYMPPFNGVTNSGALFKLITTVSNAEKVTLNVDPTGVATVGDIQELQKQVNNLEAFIGFNEDNIYGLEVDYENSKFTRLAGAVGKTAGESFDSIRCWGGRKRCIVTDDGVNLAYFGEVGYTETGKLTQAITKEIKPAKDEEPAVTKTYPVGTPVQVMVEQPKFYYKTVPLKLEKHKNGKGFYLVKARYYISDTAQKGFKIYPKFVVDGQIIDKIYISAYEASSFDVSANAYNLLDEQNIDFNADKVASIANAKPISGLTQQLTRPNMRKLASNRGEIWSSEDITTVTIDQWLFMIEYAGLNSQTLLARGVVDKPSGDGNEGELTGATASLGNSSGEADNKAYTYRGKENPSGNLWMFSDGINVYVNPDTRATSAYVATHGFADDTDEGVYKDVGFNLAPSNGYIKYFGYSEECDYLFLPAKTGGNTAIPVGDHFWNYYTGWRIALVGAVWDHGSTSGLFALSVDSSSSGRWRSIGGRVVCVPKPKK